jgi:DNA-binding response OmpR family regulator
MSADRQSAMNAGADVFLPKPLTPTEVIERVDQLVGAVPAGD